MISLRFQKPFEKKDRDIYIFRPCNKLLLNSNLFGENIDKLPSRDKLKIAQQILINNHKDELVNLFLKRAKFVQKNQSQIIEQPIQKNFQIRRNQVALNKGAHPEFQVHLQVNLNPMTQTPCLLKQQKKQRFIENYLEESCSSDDIIKLKKNEKNGGRSYSEKLLKNQKFKRIQSKSEDESSQASSVSFVDDILIDSQQIQQNQDQEKDLEEQLTNQLIIKKRQSLGQPGLIWMEKQLTKQGIKSFTQNLTHHIIQQNFKNGLTQQYFSSSSSSSRDDFWQNKKQPEKVKTTIELSSNILENKKGILYIKKLAARQNILKMPLSDSIPEQECEQSRSEEVFVSRKQSLGNHVVKEEESLEEEQLREENQCESLRGSNCCCQPAILIVDDIPFNILPVRHMLQEFTKNIHEASNGQIAVNMFKEALEKVCGCSNRVYKLILMDLQMPVKDGIQASKEILSLQQSYPQSDWCRIVVLTSYTNEKTLEECLQIGCSQVINKPVDHHKILDVVNQHFFR